MTAAPTIHPCPECGEQPDLITAPWGVTVMCCGDADCAGDPPRMVWDGPQGWAETRPEAIREWNEQASEECGGTVLEPGHASREQDGIANGTEVACSACAEVG